MQAIDLNCDIGESYGAYVIGRDEDVLDHISSANVACGWHAGDPLVMDRTVRMAKARGVAVGAHPGYPDMLGFGRRQMTISTEELRTYLTYQVGALWAFCRAHDTKLQHVKPHGALYNTTVKDDVMVRAVAEAIAAVDPSLYYVALAGARAPAIARICESVGLRVKFEAFPDRAYTPDGFLAPRHYQGAVVKDPAEAARRALRMAQKGEVVAVDGTILQLDAQTLCVHGDSPAALELVVAIRQVFADHDVLVRAMGSGS